MILPIRYYGDPILRQTAQPVDAFDDALRRLADDMIETMYAANGIGLAGPQVGVPKRIFVALETAEDRGGGDAEARDEDADEASGGADDAVDLDALSPAEKRARWKVVAEHVMVNPEITLREGVQTGQDGCLSIPGLFVDELERDLRIRVRYQGVRGEPRELEAEGRFAHVLQHELDHLDGVLFLDRLPAAERRAFMEEHRSELAAIQREAKALLREIRRTAART